MKYKVGDKVRVKSDLYDGGMYGCCDLNEEMESYRGKIVTISLVGRDCYEIEEDDTSYSWTDEMFEPVEEMSAEEALRLQAEMCTSNRMCSSCPIGEMKREVNLDCTIFISKYQKRVIEALKQWKADHEKKPIETEFIWYLLVVEEKTHIVKCEKPLKIERERTTDEQKEELLREWCSEHDGKYYVTTERRCVVKE